jgi:serine/threonine-protein kinase
MIGKLLDHRYQVIRILATGGFGETYIAQDTRRPGNPLCVVKHLKPTSSDSQLFPTAKRLFQNEAETLERLGDHPQIPRLLAYFDENQEFFLVQEYIDGHTLSEELIPGQPWSEDQVLQMLLEILGILEFVHQQGVIHRDIKPDNIIRRASDHKLVLVDFGAVKQVRSSLATVNGQSTATVAIGTPGYMPTEQSQGRPRPNSDIYSLGIIAIQALTGISITQLQEDPHTGELLWQNLTPVKYRLALILSKMVRYYFKDRYQSVTEVIQDCQTFNQVPTTSSTPPELHPAVNLPHQSSASVLLAQSLSQKTVAVSPANNLAHNDRQIDQQINKNSQKHDPLPLLIGIFLVGGVSILATNLYPNVKNLAAHLTDNNFQIGKNCSAIIAANSNIRSQPSSIDSDNILKTVGEDTAFPVTGKRTQRGWIEVRLNSGRLAWAHSNVISNNEQWMSCLRDQEISLQIVDDDPLISPPPIPKIVVKRSINSPTIDEKAQSVEEARQKLASGDLKGSIPKAGVAIAMLKSIPQNAMSGISAGMKMTNQWQQEWKTAEAVAKDINQAFDHGEWDKVLAYKSHPEKLPNIKYWREQISPLLKEAEENLNRSLNKTEDSAVSKSHPLAKSTPIPNKLHSQKPKAN